MSESGSVTGSKPFSRGGERLEQVLAKLRAEDRVGLMTHLVLGYPSLEESHRIVDTMVRCGADVIEVQIPFSDPTADGPVITAACQKALDGGACVADTFRSLDEFRSKHDIPFLVMSYFNLVFAYRGGTESDGEGEGGVIGFTRRAAASGACGLVVPDIPPEQTTLSKCRTDYSILRC